MTRLPALMTSLFGTALLTSSLTLLAVGDFNTTDRSAFMTESVANAALR